MTFHYLDSSAWVKRYCLETGSVWIGDFFAQAPAVACSALGLIEVLSTLARKKKARELGLAAAARNCGFSVVNPDEEIQPSE